MKMNPDDLHYAEWGCGGRTFQTYVHYRYSDYKFRTLYLKIPIREQPSGNLTWVVCSDNWRCEVPDRIIDEVVEAIKIAIRLTVHPELRPYVYLDGKGLPHVTRPPKADAPALDYGDSEYEVTILNKHKKLLDTE